MFTSTRANHPAARRRARYCERSGNVRGSRGSPARGLSESCRANSDLRQGKRGVGAHPRRQHRVRAALLRHAVGDCLPGPAYQGRVSVRSKQMRSMSIPPGRQPEFRNAGEPALPAGSLSLWPFHARATGRRAAPGMPRALTRSATTAGGTPGIYTQRHKCATRFES